MLFPFIKVIAWVFCKIFFRFKVTGMENIPKDGAFLLCANHISWFDPISLAVFMKRQPRFMGKKELFKFRPLARFLDALGAYPIDRKGTDMQAYRTTMNLLKNGEGLIIFSQGTRMKEFENSKSGVALFALKTGSPIVPAGIRGSYRFFSRIEIRVGAPISMDEHEGKKVKTELIDEVMETVVARVSELTK